MLLTRIGIKKEKSRLLAVCSRGKQLLAPHIRDRSNNLVSEPQDVNMVSKTFHTSLYKTEPPSDRSSKDNLPNGSEFPGLTQVWPVNSRVLFKEIRP